MPMYGYARVSTRDQDLAAQDAELRAAGCAKVFKEKVSGSKTDRPELAKAIGRLEPGDVLVVTRLDRLARSTRDLLNVLDQIGKRGAGFKFAQGYLGRYHDRSWPTDADRAWRPGRIRARADPSPDG
jgi:DNA invertase Pin-like site-specific DNA recombinase